MTFYVVCFMTIYFLFYTYSVLAMGSTLPTTAVYEDP